MKKILLTLILIFSTALCIYAQQSFQLQFPVRCTINKDCWIINYVDDDPTTNWHDYKNGRQTYEGHTGTDIAIKNIDRMSQGVDVLAAACGTVIATRDGVPDKNALSQDINQLQNIGCGNRVAIKHLGNWITDYCHMKRGSIRVKKGDYVSAGQTIGQIGMSGLTEFPHIHINVQQNNKFYDPFTGLERYTKGSKNPLWAANVLQQLSYNPLVVYNIGVSPQIPNLLDIRNGKYQSNNISCNANMIIIWLDSFHVEKGDLVNIVVKNTNGTTFLNENVTVSSSNAKKLMYTGRQRPAGGFAKGNYTAQIWFRRPNTNISNYKSFNFVIY